MNMHVSHKTWKHVKIVKGSRQLVIRSASSSSISYAGIYLTNSWNFREHWKIVAACDATLQLIKWMVFALQDDSTFIYWQIMWLIIYLSSAPSDVWLCGCGDEKGAQQYPREKTFLEDQNDFSRSKIKIFLAAKITVVNIFFGFN